MKRQTIFLLLILLLSSNIEAQNWKPLNLSDKYNYQIDTADYITNTLWLDSVEVIEDDSVFYMNRIMTMCDTCSDNENDYYALKNQPQFLMRKMIKKSDSLYIFSDTTEFIIKPLSNYADTWIFNEANSISAIITAVIEENIFGQIDSVKIISLSNGKIIKISKNFGILQFFDWQTNANYSLVGIEDNRYFGEQVVNFYDFYNFQIGDVFQRLIVNSGAESFDSEYIKYTILSKQEFIDSIKYHVEGKYKFIHYEFGNSYEENYLIDSIITFYNTQFINLYNHECVKINDYINEDYYEGWFDEAVDNLEIYKEDNLLVKSIYGASNSLDSKYYKPTIENPDFLEIVLFPEMIVIEYKESLGLTNYHINIFEFGFSDRLIGYIRDGITYGEVFPDSWYGISNVENINNNIQIYPNPAQNFININLHSTNTQNIKINIFDYTGKIVLSTYSQNSNPQIDISALKTGMYFITIKSDKNIYKSKFIKH